MKFITALFLVILGFSSHNLLSADLKLLFDPPTALAGNQVKVYFEDAERSFSTVLKLQFDGVERDILISNNTKYLFIRIPFDAVTGIHSIKIFDILNEISCYGEIQVLQSEFEDADGTNGHDPDPDTQNGKPKNSGKDPFGKKSGAEVRNPSGGSNNIPYFSCNDLHVIDGVFTDSVANNRKEWVDIIPLNGRFSNLYIDYCSDKKVMYLLNDWFLGTAEYDSNSCYNRFELYTGGGSEHWEIWVYHSIAKGIKVIRNGVVVAENGNLDTNYVLGGAAGFASSLLYKDEHTIYEFGLKVKSGVFYLPAEHDPYRPPSGGTSVTVVCKEDGTGLVKEPHFFSGTFDDYGTTARYHQRYIPEGGVAGLAKEPNPFLGKLSGNSCKGPHVVDGEFSKLENGEVEWKNSNPAIGKYSNLYADYCDGYLYILNDWKLAKSEPDQNNCYNLFELFTAGGKQHWGIYVYHDPNKQTRVFLNAVDVSSDTNIVKGGVYGFNYSILLEDTLHTIYEFAIKADEGDWMLYLCDPSPSSYCDESNETAPRKTNYKIMSGTKIDNLAIEYNNNIKANYNDTITVSFGTTDNIESWFAKKLRMTLKYDKYLTFPVIPDKTSMLKSNLNYDSLTYSIPKDGEIVIEGLSSTNISGTGEIFDFKFISLAGNDSVSNIDGTLEIGNNSQYMYITNIDDFKITTTSKCPLTNSLISNPSLNSLVIFPNPNSNSDITNVSFQSDNEQLVNIRIYTSIGNELKTISKFNCSSGENVLTLTDLNLDNGIYFISVDNGVEFLHNSLIIIK